MSYKFQHGMNLSFACGARQRLEKARANILILRAIERRDGPLCFFYTQPGWQDIQPAGVAFHV